jgi:hypothetical protein
MLNAATVGRPRPLLELNLQEVGSLSTRAFVPGDWSAPAAPVRDGGMSVVVKGKFRSHGACSCGWRGGRHLVSAVAVHEALLHAATSRCQPSVPLVV